MPLKIVAKTSIPKKSKAVITILGLIGGNENHQKAQYYFEENRADTKEYFNTFPLLCQKYSKDYTIVPLHTKEAKVVNQKVLAKSGIEFTHFDEKYFIEDDKDFTKLFNIINNTVDELIIDVSHGFRHLPILMIVDLIIQNFKDTSKIKKILFAKEMIQFKEYEIIDLKEYLDLANIAFILSTFGQNYTVANHITSKKYENLIDKLNDFSNDMMALNIGNLPKTAKALESELQKIEDISIKNQAIHLAKTIQTLTNFDGKKRYQTYLILGKDLFEKNYMLLSLALLFESVRFFIRTFIKQRHKQIVQRIEEEQKDDYKLNQFFKNIKTKSYSREAHGLNITQEEYYELQNSFPSGAKSLYDKIDIKRNNLAHANAKVSFQDIKNDIQMLFNEYETLIKHK